MKLRELIAYCLDLVQLSTLKYRVTEDHETVKSANRTSYLVNFRGFFLRAPDSESIDPNSGSRNRPPEFQVIADFRDVEEQFL
jgi:hypothetical protein